MHKNVPNLRHLRAFREVAINKNISLSAEKIFISQSAITQAINKLEQHFGTSLFNRSPSGMFLTERGEILFRRVDRCLNLLQQGVKDAIRSGNGKAGTNPLNIISTSQLRALIALEGNHSFSMAARSINISQPSLHRSARELEDHLSITLFEKTNIGISLTKAALILSRSAKLAFSELRQGFEEVNESLGIESSYIAIGSMPLARTYILPMALNQLTVSRPQMSINVIDGPYEDLLQHLRQGDIDFLIGALRGNFPSKEIIEETLFETSLSIVARAGHPLAGQSELTLEQLAQYPWVVPRKGTPARSRFEAMFEQAGIHIPMGLIECSSQILIRQLLQASDRLTFLSKHQITLEEKQGILATLAYKPDHSSRPIGLTYRTDWHPTSAQKELMNYLRDLSRNIEE
ncbi:LysR family transcriptional regulator [Gynuella sunshinyii]|uniref:Transcriptional regulator n=1 Tax=Gynuella sunshinyii YC6258 TaxID=1445510 RepID=A0A0C5W0C9_9GAMM|nr:LysR family transcriptional regulator [Gynuella sunshinyii]AJQ96139.1 transcriptional regulator [Gynuella sunshinyii YC6258]